MLIGFRLCLIAECIVCKERNSLFVTLRLGGWMGWEVVLLLCSASGDDCDRPAKYTVD